ncbi:Putative zincin peptidase [Salinicoccus halodurans]|uniref:Zincin peptidase n=1 Tax=Salinicoccus halodurans TaxID=407035 RepID=A0AA94HHN8_9STAP|nr:Putative zincin peptidase [Salinicoccus halodurans]
MYWKGWGSIDKYELNIFDDKKSLNIITAISVIITVIMLIPPIWMDGGAFLAQMTDGGVEFRVTFGTILITLALLFAVFTFHEGIHGLFFKLFSPATKVKFGYMSGMLYATAPGEVYSRKQYIVIILMPFLLITAILLLLMFTFPHASYKYLLAIHTGGCAGDFYYVYLMLKYRNLKYAEDTDVGMTLYETQPNNS